MSIFGGDNISGLAAELQRANHQPPHQPLEPYIPPSTPIVAVPGSAPVAPATDSAQRETEDRTVLRTIPAPTAGVHIELVLPDGRRAVVQGRTVIGRTTPVQPDAGTRHIQITDPTKTISKMHLVLDPLPGHGGTWVTDLASTNGTSIIDADGQIITLTPMSAHWVDATSTLQVGDVDIKLTVTHGNLESPD